MRRTTPTTRRLAAFVALASLVAALGVVAPTVGDQRRDTASAATLPTVSIMGQSQLTAGELVRFYNSVSHLPYRSAGIPVFGIPAPTIEDLANLFINEGARYNVRGDVAFVQSLVETAWFNFMDYPPYTGQVHPWNFNYAGIGACDACGTGWQFSTPLEGVRAQMQLLRNYADINSRTWNIPDPPVPNLWGSTPQRAADNFNDASSQFSVKGRAPNWNDMGNGNWATSTTYASTIITLYKQVLAFFGRTLAPETIAEHYAALGGSSGFVGSPTGPEQVVPGGRMRGYWGPGGPVNIYWTPGVGAFEVHGAILAQYLSMDGPSSPLGFPVSDETSTAGGGKSNAFQGGAIYYTAGTGAQEVHGGIGALYQSMGGPTSVLGFPVSDEQPGPNGSRFNDFQGGGIYWSAATGAHEVHGQIGEVYRRLGGPGSVLGLPVGDERGVPSGRAVAFQNGEILWAAGTGAHEVHGPIAFLYMLMGGPGGILGFPTSDEAATSGGGTFNDFQGGSIYWSPATGVHEVHGQILGKYRAMGGPGGVLGFPTSNETDAPGGRKSAFQGGDIYWSLGVGAHEVQGSIAGFYAFAGGPASFLGWLLSDEMATSTGGGRFNVFERGSIYWSAGTGTHEVHGPIRDFWISTGAEGGPLGLPISNEVPAFDGFGRASLFEHGSIAWTPLYGAFRSS